MVAFAPSTDAAIEAGTLGIQCPMEPYVSGNQPATLWAEKRLRLLAAGAFPHVLTIHGVSSDVGEIKTDVWRTTGAWQHTFGILFDSDTRLDMDRHERLTSKPGYRELVGVAMRMGCFVMCDPGNYYHEIETLQQVQASAAQGVVLCIFGYTVRWPSSPVFRSSLGYPDYNGFALMGEMRKVTEFLKRARSEREQHLLAQAMHELEETRLANACLGLPKLA